MSAGNSARGLGRHCPAALGFLLAVILAACGVAIPPSPAPTASPMPTAHPTPSAGVSYTQAPCAFTPPGGEQIACGWLAVPERRGAAESGMIRLHVATIQSHSAHPAPDPLVVLGGGPGQRTIDALLAMVSQMGPVLAQRAIVIFDQRGAGYSQPSLDCPEQDLVACRDRLVRAGIDLAGYTNNENADDVNDLRLALGYGPVNLYGGSYGTLLALTTMRRHPEGVRGAVLDSVVPPQISIDIEEARAFEKTLNRLFEACAGSAACNAAYPDLRDVYLNVVTDLNTEPATIHLKDPASGIAFDSSQTGDSFAYLVWFYMQYTEAVAYLPRLIYQTQRGDFAPLADAVQRLVAMPNEMSEGMSRCVSCSCMIPFESPQAMRTAVAGLHPALQGAVIWPDYETCAVWQVPQTELKDRDPVRSDIPTLLLSGEFDPLTPPSFAAEAAATLSRHYAYVVPATGHGVVRTSPCAWQMISAFLDNPAVAPGSQCLDAMSAPEFVVEPQE
jgi:pimeloyl-ACP methyl ester carboxylesterase